MKLLYSILCLVSLNVFSQNFENRVDTSYYPNGKMNAVRNLLIDSTGNEYEDGHVVRFDTLGNKIVEGQYKYFSFVECVNCYNFINQKPVIYVEATRVNHSVKYGQWTEYYPNGRVKSTGNYSGRVNEMYYLDCSIPNSIGCDGCIRITWEKEGIWEYFDEDGNLTRSESYLNGILITETLY
jgi:antitoxin component YwqK of YwqJK toxin-antitoxin module